MKHEFEINNNICEIIGTLLYEIKYYSVIIIPYAENEKILICSDLTYMQYKYAILRDY